MKLSVVSNVLVSALISGLLMSTSIWAYTSSTHAHRLNTSSESGTSSKWFVEISLSSFLKIEKKVHDTDPLFTTIERIRNGFDELLETKSEGPSLGFYWQDNDDSMCSLHRVRLNSTTKRRELVLGRTYTSIESIDGSCKVKGLHLRDIVRKIKSTVQIGSGRLWGVTFRPGDTIGKYRPLAANIDQVPIMVGMVPISSQPMRKEGQIRRDAWKKWLFDSSYRLDWPSVPAQWQGIETNEGISPVPIAKWQGWISAMPQDVIQAVELAKWSSVAPLADTPPVTAREWQDWFDREHSKMNLIEVHEWKRVNPSWSFDSLTYGSATAWERVIWAAKLSQDIFRTPALGTLIESICPPEFLTGQTHCILPDFEDNPVTKLIEEKIRILRVPIVKSDNWLCDLSAPECVRE